MEMDAILTAITNVGFPITCCIVMFFQNDKFQKTLAEISTTLTLMNDRIKELEEEMQKGDK